VDVEPRSIGPFIVENLVQTLQTSYSFSKIRIREYPAIITSDAQAQAIAEANGAVVIVWGAYDDEFINIEVQLGVTDAYPQIPFDRELLENTANVDVRLTDEHEQSVAPQVLGALATLQNAAGDGVEASRSLAILEGLDVTSGEILGDGVGPNAQRFFATYIEEPEQALETITAAIEADPGNPLIYVLLAIVKLHLGDVDSALLDLGTAERLGPDEWPIPLFVRANIALTEDHIESAIRAYDTLIELRPDDWFPYSIRGGLYYLTGDYLLAQSDLDRSLELSPTANFPYTFSIILALRDGRITDAFNNIQFIVNDFPDTTLSTRMMRAIGTENSLLGPIFPAVGNLILGQYEAALTDIDVALAIDDNLAELYMMQGLAYCSLEDFEAAEAAYSNAIERDPEFALLYMLRANARFELNNLAAALEDVGIAQGFSLGAEFDTLLDAGMAGEVTCQNFFDYQP
jgi:tetratricopeptide (TPR) repeat protein